MEISWSDFILDIFERAFVVIRTTFESIFTEFQLE